MYYHQLKNVKQIYEEECGSNLIEAFSHLQKRGNLEIITCAATHGFLPLFSHPACVRAQLKMAVKNYEKHFGCRPNGVWLPECGYEKGLDKELVNVGLKYFFLDSHGILYGNPRPKYGVFAPVKCKSGAVAFGRDIESSRAVWSSQTGYPGDPAYREFYRDIGHDESIDYVGKYLGEDRERKNLGIKYFRITGHHVELGDKEPYNPEMALMRAAEHANNFIFNRKRQVQFLNDNLDRSPLIVSPYDAELFGHWWYEGPVFIENVLRGLADPRAGIEPITPSMYMERFPEIQTIQPSPSSWGDKGYYEMWLNGTNDWIYKLLHKAEKRMVKIAYENKDADCEIKKCLNQASRELMLAQASDWAFIMTTGTMVEYAEKRTKDHVTRFNELCDMVDAKNIDNKKFNEIKAMDNIFPEMDFSIYL
jgi:1,4-alpha-glucan branching enzyme